MANKTILGIDIGYDCMKLALMSGGKLKQGITIPMPEKMIRDGRIVSVEALGELLRSAMKEYSIRCRDAAVVLSGESVFIRGITMPKMSAEQLEYNLPYEFRDYITDELQSYVFDYAMISKPEKAPAEETGSEPASMELLGVAAPRAMLEEMRTLVRKAGMKLTVAAPTVCAWANVIRDYEKRRIGAEYEEYCILDLGCRNTRMYMFRGDRHITTRELEVGISNLVQVVAEVCHVDEHLAETYLTANHENCQNSEACLNACTGIGVELMRAFNFYQFSNPESRLADVWLCGGGAGIAPLCQAIDDALPVNTHPIRELLDESCAGDEDYLLAQAVGITLQ